MFCTPPLDILTEFKKHEKPDAPHNDKVPRIQFFLQDSLWRPKTSEWYQFVIYKWFNDQAKRDLWKTFPVEKRYNFDFWDILEYTKWECLVKGFRLTFKSFRFQCEVDLHSETLTQVINNTRRGWIIGNFFFDNQKNLKNTSLGINEIINLNK